jgi:hypothetical protein
LFSFFIGLILYPGVVSWLAIFWSSMSLYAFFLSPVFWVLLWFTKPKTLTYNLPKRVVYIYHLLKKKIKPVLRHAAWSFWKLSKTPRNNFPRPV